MQGLQFQFLDAEAEDIQHEAICRHFGVLTPSHVQEIRRRYKLSRAGFSQITKIGEASIARWERGELIQNAAYDQLLYLLTFEDNLQRLKDRRVAGAAFPRPMPWQGPHPVEPRHAAQPPSVVGD